MPGSGSCRLCVLVWQNCISDHRQTPHRQVVVLTSWLNPRSWGASTSMKMCIQAVLDATGALIYTLLQTGLKIHWSRRSASTCFNRAWRVTKSSAKHHSFLSPWVLQHPPWPSPSAWTETRSLHGCRNFYLLILPSLSFSLSFSLSLLLLLLDRTDVCSPLLCLSPTQFRAKIYFSREKEKAYFVVTVTSPSLQGLHA